jgi:hypothetical protein
MHYRLRLATEQHRDPGAQQFPHELSGMCPIVGDVAGELRSLRAIPRHDAHFDGRRVVRKTPAINRKPVPFRELKQHRGITARSHHASCRRVWCKPEFLQALTAFHASDAIPSVQQIGRSTVGIEHRGRGWKLLDPPTGCLTAVAIAGGADNRSAASLEDDAAAGASSGQNLRRTYRRTRLPHSTLRPHAGLLYQIIGPSDRGRGQAFFGSCSNASCIAGPRCRRRRR